MKQVKIITAQEAAQLVKDGEQPLVRERVDVGRLDIANDLQTHPLKVVEKARKLQAGAGDLLDHDLHGVKIRRRVHDGQMKVLDDLFHRDAV